MKNLAIVAFVIADATLIVLALLWMLAGYLTGGAVALIAALALVLAAARFWADSPEPVPAPVRAWLVVDEPLPPQLSATEEQMLRFGLVTDPVDVHQAQMARALHGSRFGMACYADTEPTYVWFPDSKTLGR